MFHRKKPVFWSLFLKHLNTCVQSSGLQIYKKETPALVFSSEISYIFMDNCF